MTTSSLLDIDVDSLFEQCSISEIDLVHKKLQQSIEAKKEELRIMVGYVSFLADFHFDSHLSPFHNLLPKISVNDIVICCKRLTQLVKCVSHHPM